MLDKKTARLKQLIEAEVFVTKERQRIVSAQGTESNWLFDFRRILMRGEVLELLGDVFWERYNSKFPLQLGCLEVAGIPMVTGIACRLHALEHPVNAFFIRKSRKKHGLLNMIEGEIDDTKIILVDDIINSGKSFMRQVEVLESLGKKVDTIFTILQFRDESFYSYFLEKGIAVESLFTLDDFSDSLGLHNLGIREEKRVSTPFTVEWYFKSENPNYFYVVPKSAPAVDDTKLYFGSDSGNFWALNQRDGSVTWKFKVGLHAKGKNIFSSPVVHKGVVYFGAYDGNFYALDTATGKPKWIFMEADWIGSSPAIAPKLGLVFVGLEFGFWKKKGGIVALRVDTGEKVWEYTTPDYVHSSPAYDTKSALVVCGSNNNATYALHAKTGKVVWKFQTEGEVKASFAFYDKKKYVVFASHDSYIYILKVKTGELVKKIKTEFAIYSTPLVYGDRVYVGALDKKLYCIDLNTLEISWEFLTSGRIFASPFEWRGHIYIGSNDARLYELDPVSGNNTAVFQATERITNAATVSSDGKRLLLPTFANEIFCLKRDEL